MLVILLHNQIYDSFINYNYRIGLKTLSRCHYRITIIYNSITMFCNYYKYIIIAAKYNMKLHDASREIVRRVFASSD